MGMLNYPREYDPHMVNGDAHLIAGDLRYPGDTIATEKLVDYFLDHTPVERLIERGYDSWIYTAASTPLEGGKIRDELLECIQYYAEECVAEGNLPQDFRL